MRENVRDSPWPIVPLSTAIKQRKEFITIDDFKTYKRCRVQLHAKGIVLRDEIEGYRIKTKKQQVCKTGEFLVAEIDAKVGGFGIVPPELEGAIVSSHYFLFVIDESKLDRRFLGYYIRTRDFRDQVNAQGSTNYASIRPQHVLGYEIPLPPLTEQRRIVARIERLAAKVAAARKLREEAVAEVEALWLSQLQMVFSPLKETRRLEDACELIVDTLHSTPKYDGNDYACVRSQDVGWGTINYRAAQRISEQEFRHRIQTVISLGLC